MTITERLIKLDPTLQQHNEGAWDKPFDSKTAGFSSFNDAGIECETGEFLYSIVRLMKPKHVLETGTHHGIGAAYMGLALKDNHNGGLLDTIEFLPEIYTRASERIMALGLQPWIKQHLTDAAKFDPHYDHEQHPDGVIAGKYGMILLDTEPQTRFAELLKFYPYLMPGGFLFIHDLHPHMHQIPNEEHGFAWPYGKIPDEMRKLVINGNLRPFHFKTPRGLTGFYNPHQDDYKWENTQ